jgi:tetratricopeptide (TPR) repeat protein
VKRVPPLLLLLAATLLAHGNALGGAFQFDDYRVIVDNPGVHGLAAWAADPVGIRPLLRLTYALNWSVDPRPAGFILVNLLLHAGSAALAFRLLGRLGSGERPALAAALLWAVHPAGTEAVAYVCGRSTSLMAVLVLGSLLAHARARDAARPGPWRAASLLLFLLACLAKETALALPLAVLLFEICAPPRRDGRGALRAAAPMLAVAALLAAGVLLHPRHRALLAYSFDLRPAWLNLAGQVQGVGHLLGVWVRPWTLNIDPGLPVPQAWTPALGVGAAALLAPLIAAAFALRRHPAWAFGPLWAAAFLLATNSLIPRLDVVNDRQLYLPGLGLAWLAALALERAGRARPWLLGALLIVLGLLTARRDLDYRSEATLWRASLRANPRNPRAHTNLGWALGLAGDRAGAAACYRRALALDPDHAQARSNLEALEGVAP